MVTMTKASPNKKRKVTFDVPESDYDSDSSDSSESDNRKSKVRLKKSYPQLPKFEPPPLNTDIKLKSILKNNKPCTYAEPKLTTSLLPLHIINSVINAKFGPLIDSFEESDSGNSSDESDTLSNDLYLKTKGNLDVEYNNTFQTSRQNSIDELSRDDWLLSFKDEDSEEAAFINDSKEINVQQSQSFENSLRSLIEAESLNKNIDVPLKLEQNSTLSSDTSESSENSEKPKAKKLRRKLKVSIEVHDNSGDTDSEIYELELCDSKLNNSINSPSVESVPKPNLLYYNAHEISYLGYYCDENFDLILTIPENLTLRSYSDFNNAVVRFPPVVLESKEEEEEDLKQEEEAQTEPEIQQTSIQLNSYQDFEDKENILDFVQINSIKEPILKEEESKEINNNTINKSYLNSPKVSLDNQLSFESNSVQHQSHFTPESPTTESHLVTTPTELSQQTSTNKRTSKGHHKSSKKRIFLAVRIPCESEESPTSPTKRNIKPYTKKTRKPLKVTMEHSDTLNCAGEPELLTANKRDDIKEKDILIWIYNMIDEPARVDYEFFLKDGCILCKLMNRIKPGSIPEDEITWEGARSKQKNVQNFLTHAEKYGVPKAKLFYPEDLLHLRHIPRVTRCIYALAKLAQEDPDLGPDCPQLGDEPNFVQTAKKVEIPGHRDTKEVLSQFASSMQKKDEKKSTKHSLYQ